MVINASMKMTTTALMVALSRANAASSVKYLGQKRKFRFEMPRYDSRSQWSCSLPQAYVVWFAIPFRGIFIPSLAGRSKVC